MKRLVYIGTLVLFILTGCTKEETTDLLPIVPTANTQAQLGKQAYQANEFILTDYFNGAEFILGDTMKYEFRNNELNAFDFVDYRKQGANQMVFTLGTENKTKLYTVMVQANTIITGKRNAVTFNCMNITGDTLLYATTATVIFNEYHYPGKITGTVEAYMDTVQWVAGRFDFEAVVGAGY